MSMVKVIKRSGEKVDFDESKIITAITKAMIETKKGVDMEVVNTIVSKVVGLIDKVEITIEEIQDLVVQKLLTSRRKDVAEKYISHRSVRSELRHRITSLDVKARGLIEATDTDVMNENSNKDAKVIPVMRDLLAGVTAKDYALKYMIPKDIGDSHEDGDIHFHDLDYSPFFPQWNCMLIDLENMLKRGFKVGNTQIETPKSISVACAVTAQTIAQVSSHIYGGNTINGIDSILAPYVRKSFVKHFMIGVEEIEETLTPKEKIEGEFGEIKYGNETLQVHFPKAYAYATKRTIKETFDSFQALEYEVNTLFTANGQTPFTTFGIRGKDDRYDGEYNWENREIQKAIFKNRIRGLGKEGKTAIFPKLVYALEDGVNLKEGDPNFDITQLASECSAKRMYPDILSVPKVKEVTGSFKFPMGCRSFLGQYIDENGNEVHDGRFNMGVVTINLPRVAIQSNGDEDKFFEILDERLQMVKRALMLRIERLKGTKSNVAPILYMEGATGHRLNPEDTIDHLLKDGYTSISLGYIGIHETIMALYGRNIFGDKELKEKSIKIVKYLLDATKKWKEETGYGFSLYSTPAENLCSKFCKLDREKFGEIEGVTDKGYYMNSFHLDVNQEVTPFEKIDFEKDYPSLASGGFISYVELNSLVHNPKALLSIWQYAYERTPYFAINTPTDKCFECGFEGEFNSTSNGFTCPNCGNNNPLTSSCIRRCCGYLSEPSSRPFNEGKQVEVTQRCKHM